MILQNLPRSHQEPETDVVGSSSSLALYSQHSASLAPASTTFGLSQASNVPDGIRLILPVIIRYMGYPSKKEPS